MHFTCDTIRANKTTSEEILSYTNMSSTGIGITVNQIHDKVVLVVCRIGSMDNTT